MRAGRAPGKASAEASKFRFGAWAGIEIDGCEWRL